jgi:uncharacterized RDD family membrane protein YckC
MPTRCPRCHRESARPTPFCGGCGAPLLLGEDVARPLDVSLELDRRGGGRGPPKPAEPTPEPPSIAPDLFAELAAVDRSDWDLGRADAAADDATFSGFGVRPPVEDATFSGLAVPAPPDGAVSSARPDPLAESLPAGPPAPPRPDDALPEPEVDVVEIHVERAATWRRVAAAGIDALPFAAAGAALGRSVLREAAAALPRPPAGLDGLLDLLARERVIALSLLAAMALGLSLYATLAHALAGATLGKWLLRVRVIGPDGARPSPARSAARSALAVCSAGLLGLGLILALFTRSGRALHDLIARTWVVKAP